MKTAALTLAVTVAIGSGAAAAQPADDPGAVIRRAVTKALEVLRDPELQSPNARSERVARLRAIADDVFDWQEMAERSLGHHWRRLDAGDQRRFVEVFVDLIANAYLDDLDKFRGDERVLFDEAERRGERAEVETTVITHSRDRVPMIYYLHREPAGWKIHDISIEGVSLVNHYRDSFRRFLVNKSFDELITRLEARRGG